MKKLSVIRESVDLCTRGKVRYDIFGMEGILTRSISKD